MYVHIFWSAVFSFLVGVFAASFLLLGWAAVGLLALVGLGALAVSWLKGDVRTGALFLVVAACAGCGIVRMQASILSPDPALDMALGSKISIEGVIVAEPDVRENSTRLFVRTESGAGVLVVAPLHVDVQYGDRIRAEGALQKPTSFAAEAGREFNYPAYLAASGIQYELSFARVEHLGSGEGTTLKAGAIVIKEKYLEGLSLSLPEPHAGLAGGITAGDKRGLGEKWSDIFRTVGLTHIVVLSGYNIMIVIWGLSLALSWFGVGRKTEFAIGVFVAIFFTFITGFAPASVRAALMAIIGLLGKLVPGRVYLASRALGFVAAGMVLWNPYLLAYDPGFQLSVIATWGLIFISPLILPHLSFLTEKLGLREIAATTTGTQIAVLPLLLYHMGQLSLISFPANLLVLIAVPWAMLFSAVASLGGLVAGPLAPIIGFPAFALLSYILTIAEWAARIPGASVSIGVFPPLAVVLGYAILIALQRSAAQRLPSLGS